MAVYVDSAIWHWKGRKWCHLMADDIDELHRFASRLGIHRLSYQGPPKTSAPHYDITGFERDRAIRMGAIAVGRAEIVALYRRVRVARSEMRKVKRQASVPVRASGREAAQLTADRYAP